MKIGFLVNPIAGMGGAVGLKGSDGKRILEEAKGRGARKVAPKRAETALATLRELHAELEILTAAGEMGAEELGSAGLPFEVVFEPRGTTTKADTARTVRKFEENQVELIVFVGGDGTAIDVLETVDGHVPIIGIPSGVKMHSAVFLNRPEDLGPAVSAFERTHATKEAEVMDIDEALFRKGFVKARLYGIARIPDASAHMQSGKASYESLTAEDEAREIGQYIADTMEPATTYILGPGTTTSFIGDAIGIHKTLLGVDVVADRKLVKADATEDDLIGLIAAALTTSIILSPIGSQGFFLGRGNQQISAKVVRAAGLDSIIVVATPTKLRDTRVLRVDTGDPTLDHELKGRIKVVTGYKRRKLMEVR